MSRFSCQLQHATPTAAVPIGLIQNQATTARIKVYDVTIGSSSAPLAEHYLHTIERVSGAPTGGTSVTPNPLDEDGSAVRANSVDTNTTAPASGTGVVLLSVGLHQQNTFHWQARQGSELVCQATDNDGFGHFTPVIGGTSNIESTIMFEE